MYCSSCGVAVAQGLAYCNYCGAKLIRGDGESRESDLRPESLVASIVALFILGLGAITVLLGVMKAVLGLNDGVIVSFALLSFLLMLIIEGVLIRLLLRRTRANEKAVDTVQLKGQVTNELDEVQPRVLPEPVSSVTDHTTRVLEPISTERK